MVYPKTRLPKPLTRLIYVFIAIIATALVAVAEYNIEPLNRWLVSSQPGLYRVIQVNDGDTITVDMNGAAERVRLIGIDTPELHHPEKPVQCFAHEARNFTASLINGHQVRLEADYLDDNRDLYGRLLRYVYLPDETLVNTEIVKAGYGFAYTYFPFTKVGLVEQLEREARLANRGLWAGCSIEQTEEGIETNPA